MTPAPRQRPDFGKFVVLVGPDGVGKTTVASALSKSTLPDFRYFHFRPKLTTPLATSVVNAVQSKPASKHRGYRLIGWVRLLRNYVLFWLTYVIKIRPALRSGALVVGDRWAYGYLLQPHSLKYYGPRGLARRVLRRLPQPDLVAGLSAPPTVIVNRKQELSINEIFDELQSLCTIPARRIVLYDATCHPSAIARSILRDLFCGGSETATCSFNNNSQATVL